jgi:hypothetical protein
MRFVGLIVLSLLCQGCASSQYYFRSAGTSKQLGIHAAGAVVRVSDDSQKSSFQIKCLGVHTIPQFAGKSVLFRIFFDNRGMKPWSVDLPSQEVRITSISLRPIPLNPLAQTVIHPGPTQFADFAFALSEEIQDVSQIPEITFVSKITIDSVPFEFSSRFIRTPVSSDDYSNSPITQDFHMENAKTLSSPSYFQPSHQQSF